MMLTLIEEKILFPLIGFILGVFFMHIWGKFKNRITLLKYTVWHGYLGASVDDPRFGSLKLLYNNEPIKNLYMSTVLLRNESNRDLSNIELNIVCDPNSAILVSYGWNEASVNELVFTDKYVDTLLKQNPEDMKSMFGKRDYKLPVLNREDKIRISLLITNFKGMQPFITVGCDYPGIKMKYVQEYRKLFGEPETHSALLGALVALLLCIPIIFFINNKTIAVLLAAFIGLFASLLGVLIRKFYKLIVKILS